MCTRILAFVSLLALAPGLRAQGVEPPPGTTLRVGGSLRIAPGNWLRPAVGEDGRAGVILLEGLRGATLDLSGVALRGAPAGADPDTHAGWGIVLRGCRDVRIVGGKLGGYRGCIVAEDCVGLVLEDLLFDDWFRQRLLSTAGAESGADWLWPHANDEGEWLANYGAAISLTDCRDVELRRSRGRHGQNGVLLTRCEGVRVYDCDFSFLSGWGLGMYRSSRNTVARNRFDYCVRGYSDGRYWRGQDSAGILMFERCADNVIALNSATHGGDGVFLFAGRDLVEGRARERGESDVGGSDRNLFWRNDLSFAVANAWEGTFSRDNRVVENRLDGSHQHGLWGGYSERLAVLGNSVIGTRGGGISIEHGRELLIQGNAIEENASGVELWWDEDPELVGGPFGAQRDTDSRDAWVIGNSFAGNDADLVVRATRGLRVGRNVFDAGERVPGTSAVTDLEGGELMPEPLRERLAGAGGWMPSGVLDQVSLGLPEEPPPEALLALLADPPTELPGSSRPWDPANPDRRGLDTIVMGEWGPWDFESDEPRPSLPLPGGLLAGSAWDVRWFRWEEATDPRVDGEGLARWRALAEEPLARGTVGAWSGPYGSDDGVREAVGGSRFGLLATARVSLPAGRYRATLVSDDGVRLRVDGEVVVENWTWHAPTSDEGVFQLGAGEHELLLEYFQIDGAMALTVDLQREE